MLRKENEKTAKIEIVLGEEDIELLSKVHQKDSLSEIKNNEKELLAFLQKIGDRLSQRAVYDFQDVSRLYFPIEKRYNKNRYLVEKLPNTDFFRCGDQLRLKAPILMGTGNEGDLIDPKNFKTSKTVKDGETVMFSAYVDNKQTCSIVKLINNKRYRAITESKNLAYLST